MVKCYGYVLDIGWLPWYNRYMHWYTSLIILVKLRRTVSERDTFVSVVWQLGLQITSP